VLLALLMFSDEIADLWMSPTATAVAAAADRFLNPRL